MNKQKLPVIDISRLDDERVLGEIEQACRQWGAFQVVHHGVSDEVVRGLRAAMTVFFNLPLADKRAIMRSELNPWGYYDQELTRNTPDWKEIFDYGPTDGDKLVPRWPPGLPTFRAAVEAYYQACEQLGLRLLGALAANLGVCSTTLNRHFQETHTSFVRLNYYPPCPEPEAPGDNSTPASGHLGLNPHTDAGVLTVLLQDEQAGLQVFRGGLWHLVEPLEGALVVNLGDIMQVWSNDRYVAPVHRVLANTGASRQSAPFFLNPSYQTDYEPLESTVNSESPARYSRINWGEFRSLRALGDYGDYGEEVQISRYRIRGD